MKTTSPDLEFTRPIRSGLIGDPKARRYAGDERSVTFPHVHSFFPPSLHRRDAPGFPCVAFDERTKTVYLLRVAANLSGRVVLESHRSLNVGGG